MPRPLWGVRREGSRDISHTDCSGEIGPGKGSLRRAFIAENFAGHGGAPSAVNAHEEKLNQVRAPKQEWSGPLGRIASSTDWLRIGCPSFGQSQLNIQFSILSREISAYSRQFTNARFRHGAQTILKACEGRARRKGRKADLRYTYLQNSCLPPKRTFINPIFIAS